MEKLLAKYKSNPCKETAIKLREHAVKHPFSTCFLSPCEWAVINEAKELY